MRKAPVPPHLFEYEDLDEIDIWVWSSEWSNYGTDQQQIRKNKRVLNVA
jgi:hypothetical protein